MSSIDFTSFLKLMAHKKASDLFITAGVPPSMKVQGQSVRDYPKPINAATKSRNGFECDVALTA